MPDSQPRTLGEVLDRFETETEGAESVSVGDLFDAIGDRAFGPLLLFPALVLMTPVGGIPFVPTAMGILIALVAVQRLAGLDHPWIPNTLENRCVEREKLLDSFSKIKPLISKIDKAVKRRLSVLVEGPMRYAIAVIVLSLAVMIPPLELLPFAAMVPGFAVFLFALALIAQDGVVAILALSVTAVIVYFASVTFL